MVHFSGSRVQSGEIEFSPNPLPLTSFKDDTISAKGEIECIALNRQIVNRSIGVSKNFHEFQELQ